MRSVTAATVLAVAITAAGPAIGESAAKEPFEVGQWKGAAYFKDNKLVRCAMGAPYINRWDLFFAIDDAGYFSVILKSARLDLLADLIVPTKRDVRMQIDESPVIIRPFTAMSTTMAETKFATNLDWVQRLSTGKVLRINPGSRTYRFPLHDLKEALPKLRDCAAKHRKA